MDEKNKKLPKIKPSITQITIRINSIYLSKNLYNEDLQKPINASFSTKVVVNFKVNVGSFIKLQKKKLL